MHRKEMTKNRWLGVFFFCLYLIFLFYVLFFSELKGRGFMNRAEFSYNMEPFKEIFRFLFYWKQIGLAHALENLLGNIIGFCPLGFLLPRFSKRCRMYWYNTVMSGYLLSFGVEAIQLIFRAGSCDVDDIILNTLGTALGYVLFRLIQRERRRRKWKEKSVLATSEKNGQREVWEP
ncbi:MAG: VanZ family protein [Oribacterium sinus]|uniref:VanZ family protein n=1 Tax=Oribacterium sinus TaxID=237576 RepID=A0A930H0Z6_9FIRM|nr:VanZ family protein [Oribacterium sinus]